MECQSLRSHVRSGSTTTGPGRWSTASPASSSWSRPTTWPFRTSSGRRGGGSSGCDLVALGRSEQEDGGAAAFFADHLEPAADAGGPFAHPDQSVAAGPGRGETTSLVRDLDQKGPSCKRHPDATDRRTGMPAHIGERFAHDLVDDL